MSEKLTKLQKNAKKLDNMVTQFEIDLSALEHWNDECHCEQELGFVNLVHQGEMYSVQRYCLSCGGIIQS